MKLFLILPFFLVSLSFSMTSLMSSSALATANSGGDTKIVLGVFDHRPKSDFEEKVMTLIKTQLQGCVSCEVKNYSTYDAKGQFVNNATTIPQVELMAEEANVVFINYNEKLSPSNQALVTALDKVQANIQGKVQLLIFAAGQPPEGQSSAPLSQTIAGHFSKALIIGEIGEKDRLLGASFFGPEMLTAFRPPKDQIGQGLAPAIFTAMLVKNFRRHGDWVQYLNERKAKNKKIWLDFNDCFR